MTIALRRERRRFAFADFCILAFCFVTKNSKNAFTFILITRNWEFFFKFFKVLMKAKDLIYKPIPNSTFKNKIKGVNDGRKVDPLRQLKNPIKSAKSIRLASKFPNNSPIWSRKCRKKIIQIYPCKSFLSPFFCFSVQFQHPEKLRNP